MALLFPDCFLRIGDEVGPSSRSSARVVVFQNKRVQDIAVRESQQIRDSKSNKFKQVSLVQRKVKRAIVQ